MLDLFLKPMETLEKFQRENVKSKFLSKKYHSISSTESGQEWNNEETDGF